MGASAAASAVGPTTQFQPAFAPGTHLVSFQDGQDPSLIRVWSLSQGREVRKLQMEAITWPARWGEQLLLLTRVSAKPPKWILRTWAGDEDEPVEFFRMNRPYHGADASGRMIYTVDRGVYLNSLKDFDESRARLIGEHPVQTLFATWDATGEWIASADTSGEIRIWSASSETKVPLRVFHGEKPIWNLI